MRLATHNRMILWGFGLGYVAVMGALIAAGTFTQGYRPWLFAPMAAIGVVGVALVVVGKLSRIDDEQGW